MGATRACRRPVTNDLCRSIQDTASNRRRTRITVTADHGLPVGVATPRLLSSTAIDGPTGPAKLDALRWGVRDEAWRQTERLSPIEQALTVQPNPQLPPSRCPATGGFARRRGRR